MAGDPSFLRGSIPTSVPLASLSAELTFLSSFSEADGETPRISYSLVSATFAMMLVGYTQRPSAEVQPIGSAERRRRKMHPAGAVQQVDPVRGYHIL